MFRGQSNRKCASIARNPKRNGKAENVLRTPTLHGSFCIILYILYFVSLPLRPRRTGEEDVDWEVIPVPQKDWESERNDLQNQLDTESSLNASLWIRMAIQVLL